MGRWVDIYNNFQKVKLLKKSERGSVFVVCDKNSRERFIFRSTGGNGDVYKKLMTVSCPNLPKIIAVEEDGGEVSILEEYVQGDTLYYILQGGVLSEEESAEIITQLCGGLAVLHGLGAVHRDIKPENIIIRGSEAVLIDFDASRMIDPEKNADTRILGTTGFAAPEQYGISQTDARADIYSMGVLLNIMLTGEHPSIRLASGKLGDIIQKCTMISPEKRYQNAKELMSALESARLENKKKRKNYLWPILSAVAAVALFAGISFAVFGENYLPQENSPSQGSSENSGEKDVPEELHGTEVQDVPQKDEETGDGTVKWIEVSGWEEGTGKSIKIPPEFYEYWDKSEFVSADQIKISAPGNIENYLSYEFSDDILKITVGDIPEDEWKIVCENLREDQQSFDIELLIKAPSENILEYSLQQGNGWAYRIMKNEEKEGTDIVYDAIDPKTEFGVTNRPFAEIIESENGKTVMPYGVNSVFYASVFWKDDSGNVISQILPYMIIISDETNDFHLDAAPETWMDAVWEPVTDPERIFYKNVNNEDIFNYEYLENRGIELSVFEKPGYIRVDFLEDEKVDVEILANMEAIVLPPDASRQKQGETVEEWLERVYSETEYVGFKVNSTNTNIEYLEGTQIQLDIIDASQFRHIQENGYTATNLIPMEVNISENAKTWFTFDNGNTIVIIIDWYTEDPTVNPDAKPAKREYIYNNYEACMYTERFSYQGAQDIIARGYCGEKGTNLEWTLDSEGNLIISGTGKMADYDTTTDENGNSINAAPWGSYAEQIERLVIEEGVESIGEKAFWGMRTFSGSLVLPSSIREIGFWAFCANNFSGELIIPEGCLKINNEAFQAAGSFSYIYIPSSVNYIGVNPFRYCDSKKIEVSGDNRHYCSVKGVLYDKTMARIIAAPDGYTGVITVPESVVNIGASAFESARASRINIMGDITDIGGNAFQGYNGEVAFYGNVGNISADAFSRFTAGLTVHFLYSEE